MMQPRYVKTPYGIEAFFTPVMRKRHNNRAKIETLVIIIALAIVWIAI